MKIITTEEAIDIAVLLLKRGAHPDIIKQCLFADGFKINKINTILGWANKYNG